MVPVKGIVLFNLVFLSHLFFFIHIAFVKCKYCSLVFLMEVAIDSRLSPAKVRWRQPAVSSELSLVTAS